MVIGCGETSLWSGLSVKFSKLVHNTVLPKPNQKSKYKKIKLWVCFQCNQIRIPKLTYIPHENSLRGNRKQVNGQLVQLHFVLRQRKFYKSELITMDPHISFERSPEFAYGFQIHVTQLKFGRIFFKDMRFPIFMLLLSTEKDCKIVKLNPKRYGFYSVYCPALCKSRKIQKHGRQLPRNKNQPKLPDINGSSLMLWLNNVIKEPI